MILSNNHVLANSNKTDPMELTLQQQVALWSGFSSMQTWTGPIIIGLIQLIIVIVLGRRWQMDEIWTITTKLIDKWDGKFGKG